MHSACRCWIAHGAVSTPAPGRSRFQQALFDNFKKNSERYRDYEVIAKFIRLAIPARWRPIGYLEHLVRSRTGGRIPKGPFAGMRYIHTAFGSAYVPKLLGIYERELNPFIEQACALNFPLIVDVGAAEGYYAVGMALRNPDARVIAFEMEQKGRAALKEMAELNNVTSRVEIRARCKRPDLAQILATSDRALILCDAEGDEETLLDPETIPMLAHTHLLVEVHEFVSAGIAERVMKRFAATHKIRRIWQEDRHRSDLPFATLGTTLLPRFYLDWSVSEWRPERMSWLWMEPRTVNAPAA